MSAPESSRRVSNVRNINFCVMILRLPGFYALLSQPLRRSLQSKGSRSLRKVLRKAWLPVSVATAQRVKAWALFPRLAGTGPCIPAGAT